MVARVEEEVGGEQKGAPEAVFLGRRVLERTATDLNFISEAIKPVRFCERSQRWNPQKGFRSKLRVVK